MEKILLAQVKEVNKSRGKHWFSPETTRFFNGKYPRFAYKVNNRAYFITSEQYGEDYPRLYTIRVCDLDTGSINTIGIFQQYSSREEANKVIMKLLKATS